MCPYISLRFTHLLAPLSLDDSFVFLFYFELALDCNNPVVQARYRIRDTPRKLRYTTGSPGATPISRQEQGMEHNSGNGNTEPRSIHDCTPLLEYVDSMGGETNFEDPARSLRQKVRVGNRVL